MFNFNVRAYEINFVSISRFCFVFVFLVKTHSSPQDKLINNAEI